MNFIIIICKKFQLQIIKKNCKYECYFICHIVICYCRGQGPIEFESFRNNVTLEIEKTEEKLMNRFVFIIFKYLPLSHIHKKAFDFCLCDNHRGYRRYRVAKRVYVLQQTH